MTKLELQNKIATIEKSMAKITNPAVLAIAEKNLTQAREQLAALEGAAPSPAPSGGGSELEKLYEQREKLKKGLQSSNAVVQKASKMALPKVEAQIAELEGAKPAPAPARRMPKPTGETPEVPATKPMPTPAKRGRKPSPPAPMPMPTPAKRGRKPKAEAPMPMPTPAKRGRKPKAEAPMPMPTPAKRGRKPKAEAPAEVKGKIKRGRKPKAEAPAEVPTKTPARRGRPALPKGAKSQEVSLNSLTKLANAIVQFCDENGIANPTIDDIRGILVILDKGKALKFAKGGKISRSGKYLSKWQIKQILTDGGMKIGSDEILSGVWLKKKVDGVAEMRMGGGVGYFAIKDDIIESRKSVRFGNRRVSSKNPKVVGVLEGKMVGNLMKVYDYDDEMWKVVNPDEWQQAYAEGGGLGTNFNIVYEKPNDDIAYKETINANSPREARNKFYAKHPTCTILSLSEEYAKGGGVDSSTITDLEDFDPETTLVFDGDANFEDFPEITYLGNLQIIKGDGNFRNSQVQHLGNLQTIGGSADFMNSRVEHLGNLQTIGGSADFEDSEVQNLGNLQTIGGNANFENSEIRNLGKLQTIGHTAFFQDSQVQNLGNLQTIGGSAFFENSIVKRLGNLQTIGGRTFFGNRTDLEAEWEQKQKGNNYAEGGGVEIPKNKSLRHFILNEMSDGMIANKVPYSDYDTIGKIRIQAVQILNRDGDREYSMQSVSDLIQEALLEYEENKNYTEGGGVGIPNAAWFVFQEKFPEAFEYYLKNNEYGVSKGDLMAMAYESTRSVDSAIPVELWKQVDDTMFYVYDYQNSSFGELVDLREKIKTSEVPVALSFVIDNEVFYGRNLPNELKNADFATALMYVYANRNVIDEFQIRPKRNVDNYAEGGGVGNFTLADYKANEEINNHSENALMLTKMYGTQEEINEVERLIRKGEREFGFSMEDYRRLYEISNKYYKHLVEASKSGGVGLKREKEKLRNLAYQLQNADEGWIRNNHSKFVQMQNDYKKQFKKVYGHSNYENPNNYAKGGGVGRGSFYKGQSILLHTVPSPKYERFLDIEIVIEKIDKNKIVKSFVRKTGEKVPFIIDDRFKKEEYAKGGGVDMYSKFDFNEKGNLSARINQKNYEIEYNDADGVYELFENGERVQSNKNVRTLMQFIQVSDVGNFREGQSVTIAEDNDNENYDDFRGKELVIYHKATNEKEHRGFDNSMEGQALYSFFLRETGEQVPFSCYDYELEQY